MSVQETQNHDNPDDRDSWGNGLVVISEDDSTGAWIMFDPESDEVNLEDYN